MRSSNVGLLASNQYDVYWRTLIEGLEVVGELAQNATLEAAWGADIEQLASQGTITLGFGIWRDNTSPFEGGFAQPHAGRKFALETATVAKGASPVGEYFPVFEGRIDDASAVGERTVLTCRDLMGDVIDRVLEPTPTLFGYTYPGGSMLDALDAVRTFAGLTDGIYSIVLLGNPGWTVIPYFQDAGIGAAEAMANIVIQRGWAVHYRYVQSGAVGRPQALITAYDPATVEANVAIPSYTVTPSQIISVQKCSINRLDVRNAIEIMYGAARDRLKVEDAGSIAQFTRKYTLFSEDKTSQIDTLAEATIMVNAALTSQKDPVVELDYERLYFWPVELGDRQTISIPERAGSTALTFDVRVVGFQHTLTGKGMRSVIRTRGSVRAAGRRWRVNDPRKVIVSLTDPVGVAPRGTTWYKVPDKTLP